MPKKIDLETLNNPGNRLFIRSSATKHSLRRCIYNVHTGILIRHTLRDDPSVGFDPENEAVIVVNAALETFDLRRHIYRLIPPLGETEPPKIFRPTFEIIT
jgi:hypothetical protein